MRLKNFYFNRKYWSVLSSGALYASQLHHEIAEKHGYLRFWYGSMLLDERNAVRLVIWAGDDILLVDSAVQRQDHLTMGKDRSKVRSEDRQFLNELSEKHRISVLWPRSTLFSEGNTAHLVPCARDVLLLAHTLMFKGPNPITSNAWKHHIGGVLPFLFPEHASEFLPFAIGT